MNNLLNVGEAVIGLSTNKSYNVSGFLGSGGQGEVYAVSANDGQYALKWYFITNATESRYQSLAALVDKGAPSDKFLWPIELVRSNRHSGFGYVMALRPREYKDLNALMSRKISPTFRSLALACLHTSHNFHILHSQGYCYRDVSFGNIFFNPGNGEILICDNDNVGITGRNSDILGTPRFMAPEIVTGKASPSTETDQFSLAVLMFYMLFLSHPLDGKLEASLKCFDAPAQRRLYGDDPVFIFDPDDDRNRPAEEVHGNAFIFWEIYPKFIKDAFTTTFTKGLKNPRERVREIQWRSLCLRLLDSLVHCSHCDMENSFDITRSNAICWNCKRQLLTPMRLLFENKDEVAIHRDTMLFPHHLSGDPSQRFNFSTPMVEISRAPNNPDIWGLKNISSLLFSALTPEGKDLAWEPGRSVSLRPGTILRFGRTNAKII